ncbi:MAG: hypothetical protein K2H35_03190 [Muribaculaceae bacterium]|nr:hypothetical protein [Muribaculaceae bacterium]MDE6559262.1 hypothetical protein [Muribaculaceae bacterium]
MDSHILWQYIVVLLIVIAAIIRIIVGIRKTHKNKSAGGCCGCSMASTCQSMKQPNKKPAGKRLPAVNGKNCCQHHHKDGGRDCCH